MADYALFLVASLLLVSAAIGLALLVVAIILKATYAGEDASDIMEDMDDEG